MKPELLTNALEEALKKEAVKIKDELVKEFDRKLSQEFETYLISRISAIREEVAEACEEARVRPGHHFPRSLDGERSTDYNSGLVAAAKIARGTHE